MSATLGAAESSQILIIGAGLAGLTAAVELRRRGLDVLVLEARDRVGGRVHSVPLGNGCSIDRGAQWIFAGQHRIRALADQLGVERLAIASQGEPRIWADGQPVSLQEEDLQELHRVIRRLDAMSARVDPQAPWATPRAAAWESQSFGAWLAARVRRPAVGTFFRIPAEGHHCVPLDAVSLLHALFYARSNGGFRVMLGLDGRLAPTEYFVGGAQQLPLGLAEELGRERVRLGSPVQRITQGSSGVQVEGEDFRVSGRRAIVAIPPAVLRSLRFDPPLPGRRASLLQRMPMGSGYKIHTLYERPFWRRDGWSGQALADFGLTNDSSPGDGSAGLLVTLLQASFSHRIAPLSPGERRHAILQRLGKLFGPQARQPAEYVESYWLDEPFSGGDVARLAAGAWVDFGTALRPPCGKVHWAGTETATEYYSHMEGAIQSGQRAAAEVAEALL